MTIFAWMALFVALFLPVSAIADPSFGCKAAATPAERTICATPDIAAQDTQLAGAFAAAMKAMPDEGKAWLVRQQNAWLIQRDVDCGLSVRSTDARLLEKPKAAVCLGDLYQKRISELEYLRSRARSAKDDLAFDAVKYPFVPHSMESRNQPLCDNFLKGLTESFRSVNWSGRSSDQVTPFVIRGARWITFPSNLATGFFKGDLDGNGKRSLIVYQAYDFTTGSGAGRSLFLLIQKRADVARLAGDLAAYRTTLGRSTPNADIAGVDPYNTGAVKWPDANPIRILDYKHRYYFFDAFSDDATLKQLHGDGTASLVCSVQTHADVDLPILGRPSGSPNRSSLTVPEDVARFMTTVRQMQGEEGGMAGSAHFLSILIARSLSQDYLALVKPWDLLHGRAPNDGDMPADKAEVALHDWALGCLYCFHQFEDYRVLKPKAMKALSLFYQQEFGLPFDRADMVAGRVLDRLISKSFYFSSLADPPTVLKEGLEDTAVMAQVSQYRTAGQGLGSPENAKRLLHWALLTGSPAADVAYILAHGAVMSPDSNVDTTFEEAPSFYAIEHPDLVEFLIGKGADVQLANSFGKTALMYAAQFNQEATVRVLLNHGANPNAQLTRASVEHAVESFGFQLRCVGRTPLRYAIENASASLIRLLLDAGAKLAATSDCQATPDLLLAQNKFLTAEERQSILARISEPPATQH